MLENLTIGFYGRNNLATMYPRNEAHWKHSKNEIHWRSQSNNFKQNLNKISKNLL